MSRTLSQGVAVGYMDFLGSFLVRLHSAVLSVVDDFQIREMTC